VAKSSAARTNGTATFGVFKNTGLSGATGSGVSLSAVLDATNTSVKATTQNPGSATFAAGDEIYVVVTTDGSWAPTTADVTVYVEVEF
jgi:hypothetical protein